MILLRCDGNLVADSIMIKELILCCFFLSMLMLAACSKDKAPATSGTKKTNGEPTSLRVPYGFAILGTNCDADLGPNPLSTNFTQLLLKTGSALLIITNAQKPELGVRTIETMVTFSKPGVYIIDSSGETTTVDGEAGVLLGRTATVFVVKRRFSFSPATRGVNSASPDAMNQWMAEIKKLEPTGQFELSDVLNTVPSP
jgi:hypothetical protein